MNYLAKLLVYLSLQLFTYILTPLLPSFAFLQYGYCNNYSCFYKEPRLPNWLSWFQTPDNSLLGDDNWKQTHTGTYWDQVKWLYRNSLYGFKWTVLGAPMPDVDNKYWQWRYYSDWIKLDFGWLLEPYKNDPNLHFEQPKALFQFSIRPRILQWMKKQYNIG